jgi:hypothetical protein
MGVIEARLFLQVRALQTKPETLDLNGFAEIQLGSVDGEEKGVLMPVLAFCSDRA